MTKPKCEAMKVILQPNASPVLSKCTKCASVRGEFYVYVRWNQRASCARYMSPSNTDHVAVQDWTLSLLIYLPLPVHWRSGKKFRFHNSRILVSSDSSSDSSAASSSQEKKIHCLPASYAFLPGRPSDFNIIVYGFALLCIAVFNR